MQARYERKFIINEIQKKAINAAFAPLFEADRHQVKNASYPIFSRYYDTFALDFYNQKIDGEFEHIKIRLRQYSKEFNNKNTCFLEGKYKENENQFKFRSLLDPKLDYYNPVNWIQSSNAQSLYLAHIVDLCSLIPTCNVYYDRTVYETWIEGQFVRLNFDYNICYMMPNEFELTDYIYKTRQSIGHDATILEVKTSSRELPNFITQIFRQYDVMEKRFSKYTESMLKLTQLTGDQGVNAKWN